MSPRRRGRIGAPAALLLLAAVFVAAVTVARLAPTGAPAAPWWPAAGLTVLTLGLTPRRWWWWLVPAIVVTTGVANVLGGRDVDLAVWYAVGNTAEALIVATLIRRGRPTLPTLSGLDDFVRLLVAAVIGGAIFATIAATGIVVLEDGVWLGSWRSLATSHVASTLLIVPVAMAPPAARSRLMWDLPLQVLALTALTIVVFAPNQTLSLEYLPLAMLLWAALRFDLRTVSCELICFAVAVAVLSTHGHGPFGFDYQRGVLDAFGLAAVVQAYVVTATLMCLIITIGVDQRRGLLRRISSSERLTSATLDTTNALIIVCDLYGEVVRINPATTVLTGYSEDDLVGREVWDLPFAPPGSSGYPAGLPDDVFSQVSRETGLITRSGERRQVLWNAGYVRDERDRPTYVVLTGIDLTGERTAAGLNRHLLEAAMTTALIGIDPRGRITVFNAGAVNLLGYDAQDMVGASFIDLLDPDQVAQRCPGPTPEDSFARLVDGIEKNQETAARDWTWVGNDGRTHTISMTLSMAADNVAARLGYLCVGRDVTEARASQELLVAALEKERVAVDRLRQLDTAKSEFVSTVSHELRTPVSSIVGYTEMLQDGSAGEPTSIQRRLLDSIERSGRRLIALCEDLLTLAGLDAGATNWDRAQVDLSALVTAAEDAIRPLLSGRDLEVAFAAPEPVVVLGDRRQLDRVLINLLSNAVKFTEDGGRIECRVERVGDDALLVVCDTGVGIPEDEQARLFQRFFRSSTAQHRAIPGTGLGLSIVAATVAAHGGRIDVRSAHLEGTTLSVRLPLARTSGVRTG